MRIAARFRGRGGRDCVNKNIWLRQWALGKLPGGGGTIRGLWRNATLDPLPSCLQTGPSFAPIHPNTIAFCNSDRGLSRCCCRWNNALQEMPERERWEINGGKEREREWEKERNMRWETMPPKCLFWQEPSSVSGGRFSPPRLSDQEAGGGGSLLTETPYPPT